jgi:transposase-like protein
MLYCRRVDIRADKKTRFSKTFKAEVVKLIIDGGHCSSDVVRKHDLARSQLSTWVPQAGADAGETPGSALTSTERAEFPRVRRQLCQSQREVAFLKKCALFLGQQTSWKYQMTSSKKTIYPTRWMSKQLRVSISDYYARRHRRQLLDDMDADAILAARIKGLHAASHGAYGCPCIHQALRPTLAEAKQFTSWPATLADCSFGRRGLGRCLGA